MTGDLDTEIKGEPANICAVATWLRQDLAGALDSFGTDVGRQRRGLAGEWEGEAADGFRRRAATLVEAADDAVTISKDVATGVGALADALRESQGDMSSVRQRARGGGLTVDGFIVRHPGGPPPTAGTLPVDATPQESTAWHETNEAVLAYNAKVAVWDECVALANEAFDRWRKALDATSADWKTNDTRYVNLTSALISAGVQLELIRRATPALTGEVDRMLSRAAELRSHLGAMRGPDGRVLDSGHYYDLLDEARQLEADHPGARRALSNWELPKGLTRSLWALDAAAAGYGIYSDWEDEGAAQAITSNVVPATASIGSAILAGAGTGAVVGSFVPIPGVGTAAGVVAGAIVGTAVGAFTSGAVDSLFDSGADTLGDWGDAVSDGLDEVGSTVGGVVDGAKDVFDALF